MLDVFDEEPLPNESPLWRHPNLLITPHVSGITMPEIALDQIVKNIQLIEFGETPRSLVDLDRGY
jgi:glyoxylate/hydroxypyruvate reductase A